METAEGFGLKHLVRSVEGGAQVELFEGLRRAPGEAGTRGSVVFDDRDPLEIFLGTHRLDRFLESSGSGWVLQVRAVLRELLWTEFMEGYEKRGRPPYHPASMVGLIIYGTMMGQQSLRDLERLARMDLGAMWVCGGICPDHASIGRFIQFHQARLTEQFFDVVTRLVVNRLGSKATMVAGDGTVVEAAGSRFKMMRLEAARQAALETAEQAQECPSDESLQRKAEEARIVAAAAELRVTTRRDNGESAARAAVNAVCRTDPEALLLKTKRGNFSPAYVPSALAEEHRVILAHQVFPSSEAAAIDPMLQQAERLAGPIETVLLDGNYCSGPVMKAAVEHDVTILCPPKAAMRDKPHKTFAKAEFRYESEKDVYRCPAGRDLVARGKGHKGATTYIRYAPSTRTCKRCPLRNQCLSKGEARRNIQRFETDEFREALQITLNHSRAAALMKRRKAMIEPVFSDLRGAQRLNRFRRRGLAGARLEFALHATAYNIRRLITILARRAADGLLPGGVFNAVSTIVLALLAMNHQLWIQGDEHIEIPAAA